LQTLRRLLPHIRGRVPLAVGFGVSEPEHVRTIIGSGADGAIVGGAFLKLIENYQGNPAEMVRVAEEKDFQLKAGTL